MIAAAFSPCVSGAAINVAVFEAGTYTLDGGKTFIIILDTCPRQKVTLQDGTQAGVPTCRVPLAAGDSIAGFDLLINEPAKDGGGLSDVMRFRDVGGAFTFQFMSDVDPGEGPPLDVGLPQGSTNAKTVDEIGEDNFAYTFQTAFGDNVNVSGTPEPSSACLCDVAGFAASQTHGSPLHGFQWTVATSASTGKVPQFMLFLAALDSRFLLRDRCRLFGRDLSVYDQISEDPQDPQQRDAISAGPIFLVSFFNSFQPPSPLLLKSDQ